MKTCFRALAGAFLLTSTLAPALRADVPRTIPLQGVLATASHVPLPDGTYPNVSFRLYDHASGPAQLWLEKKTVTVAGGRGAFATALGDTTAFPPGVSFDRPYWLSVQVGSDPEMTPRLPLQSVPYALNAWSIGGNSGTNPASQFLGTADNQPLVVKVNGHRALQLQDVVNAAGTVRSVNTLGGVDTNSIAAGVVGGTISGGGGATPNDLHGDFGVIGGGSGNSVDAFPYAVIAGGSGNIAQGASSAIGGGSGNNTQADNTTIGGGSENYVSGINGAIAGGSTNQSTAQAAFVGGGRSNTASGEASVIAGGANNQATDFAATVAGGQSNISGAFESFIGAGDTNNIAAIDSSIVGGYHNAILATPGVSYGGAFSAIGGGSFNNMSAEYGTIGGGSGNEAESNALYGTIGGGQQNQIAGLGSTVAGGLQNIALGIGSTVPGGFASHANADYAFAAGYRAIADTRGTFVWSDASVDTGFFPGGANEFCIRAVGGMLLEMGGSAYIYTGTGNSELSRYLELFNAPGRPSASGLKAGGILCADDFGFGNPDKNSLVVKGAVAIGTNNAGGRALYVNGLAGGTSDWNSTSDARLKTNVAALSGALDIVDSLRGVTFDWRTDTGLRFPQGRQVGFIAQEVEKVLPSMVATDDKGYKSVAYANVVPVLVEAVKTLKADNDALRAENATVEARLKRLEERLDATGR